MSGIDLETIKRMGGWKSLRMVERYAAVSTEHMEHAIEKIKQGWVLRRQYGSRCIKTHNENKGLD